jgi:hypothetical protein
MMLTPVVLHTSQKYVALNATCSSETVFEYFVDPKARQWLAWETKLSSSYKPAPDTPFFKILVGSFTEECHITVTGASVTL